MQRGNARQYVGAADAERAVYLGLLHHYSGTYRLSLIGHCLMSNHIRPVAILRPPIRLL
jgi:hypothetical protein